MKIMAWGVFLMFIAVSAAANFAHGDDKLAGALMAVVPVGFAAVITLLENMVARGKGSWPLFIAAGVVGLGAGVASYVGLATMALDHEVPKVVAFLLPLAYDGVVAVASLAIRSLGSDHADLGDPAQVSHHQNQGLPAPVSVHQLAPAVFTASPVHTPGPVPADPVHTFTAEPVNMCTQAPVHTPVNNVSDSSDELCTTVNTDVHAGQDPCTPAVNSEPDAVHADGPAGVHDEPELPVHKPAARPVNKAKKPPVNTQKGAVHKPAAADREQLRQRVHKLRQTMTVRQVATELGISTGLVNKLSKEPLTAADVEEAARAALEGVDWDAGLAEIAGQQNDDET